MKEKISANKYTPEHVRLNKIPLNRDSSLSENRILKKSNVAFSTVENGSSLGNEQEKIAYEEIEVPHMQDFYNQKIEAPNSQVVHNEDESWSYGIIVQNKVIYTSNCISDTEDFIEKLLLHESSLQIEDISLVKKLGLKFGVSSFNI